MGLGARGSLQVSRQRFYQFWDPMRFLHCLELISAWKTALAIKVQAVPDIFSHGLSRCWPPKTKIHGFAVRNLNRS